MAKATKVQANKNKNGDMGISLSQLNTDSPIIPVGDIERLHKIRPDKVDWLFEQTQAEAEFRRKSDGRVNIFIFAERIVGQILGFIMGLSGIVGSCYLGMNNHEVLAGTIATATIATLAVSFVINRKQQT